MGRVVARAPQPVPANRRIRATSGKFLAQGRLVVSIREGPVQGDPETDGCLVVGRDVEAVIFRPLPLPLPPTQNVKTTVHNFFNFCGSVTCLLLHFIILRGQKPSFIAITLPTLLELIVPNYSVFLLFRY